MSTHNGYLICVPGERKYYVQLQYDAEGWVNTPILATLFATKESAVETLQMIKVGRSKTGAKVRWFTLNVDGDIV